MGILWTPGDDDRGIASRLAVTVFGPSSWPWQRRFSLFVFWLWVAAATIATCGDAHP